MDDDRCGARKTSLATCVPSPDVPLQVLERRELMNAAAALFTPGRRRRPRRRTSASTTLGTVDPRSVRVHLRSREGRSPVRATRVPAPEDALVTVMHAGPHEETTTSALNRALTWSEYHDEYRAALARRREAERLARLAEEEAARLAEEEEYARLAAEESSLAALSPTTRPRASERGGARGGATTRREEARRLAEEKTPRETPRRKRRRIGRGTDPDATELEAERLAEEEAANAPPPLVPMPATAYDVEAATARSKARPRERTRRTARRSRSGPDGAPTVAFDGTRVGVRGAVSWRRSRNGRARPSSSRVFRRPRTRNPVNPRWTRTANRFSTRTGTHVQTRTRRERRADSRRRRQEWMVKKPAPVPGVARGRRARVGRGGNPTYEPAPERARAA